MTSNPADYCIKRYTFHANVGVGSKGKQVGSMNEEPQARGCYNFYLYTNQPGNSVGSPLWWKHEHRPHQQTRQPASAGTRGGKGTLPAQHTTLNTLDNWGHKTPTQSKRKRTGKKRLQGHGLEHVYNTLGYIYIYIVNCIVSSYNVWGHETDGDNVDLSLPLIWSLYAFCSFCMIIFLKNSKLMKTTLFSVLVKNNQTEIRQLESYSWIRRCCHISKLI